jgi:hypothetical protein
VEKQLTTLSPRDLFTPRERGSGRETVAQQFWSIRSALLNFLESRETKGKRNEREMCFVFLYNFNSFRSALSEKREEKPASFHAKCQLLWSDSATIVTCLHTLRNMNSSVGIATGWVARVRFAAVQDICLFSTASRPALEPTQPIQWVHGVKRQGREGNRSPHLMPRSRMVELYFRFPMPSRHSS